jgi:small GTP-binding protein
MQLRTNFCAVRYIYTDSQAHSMTFTLVLVGDEGVGKTSLIATYSTSVFPTDYCPKVFDEYHANNMVDGECYNLAIVDTNESIDGFETICFRADVFLLCFSWNNVDAVKTTWLPKLAKFPNAKVMLVSTKSDLLKEKWQRK